MADKELEPMEVEEVRTLISGQISDAVQYIDGELSPAREKASDYYHGRPFGNEEEGRSQVVVTEVRDSVLSVLPDLLRITFGSERVVEFEPRRSDTVASAAQASDYVQKIIEDNGGFLIFHGALKDGLIRKIGIVKHGIVDGPVQVFALENVTEEQLQQLAGQDGLELTSIKQTGTEEAAPQDPAVVGSIGAPAAPSALYSVTVTVSGERTIKIWGVPPEELLVSRDARTIEDATFLAHRMEKTRGELIALGIDEDLIDEHGGPDNQLAMNAETIGRLPGETAIGIGADAGDANDKILYIEAYPLIDVDGDGIAELRKVCTIGPGHYVVNGDGLGEPVDSRPFHVWTPDPEPHALIGGSLADLTMDLQKTQSSLLRGVLDSAAASLFPRTAYQEGLVSVQDVLNTEIGAPIRTKATPSNVLQTFSHTFTGAQLIPVIQHFDELKEKRTGLNVGAMGIDADALQSSTKQAVGAAVTASQARTEMLARVFAEMLLKPLFKGILRDLVALRPKKAMQRLRGQWVEIDPAAWDATMDVCVNVGLGSTAVDGKVETLLGIAAEQKEILSTLGPSNPLVPLAKYRNTLARICELKGFKDTEAFFNLIPADWQPPAPDPQQEQQSPEQVLAQAQMQIEQMKAQKDIALKQQEFALKQQQQEREHQRQVAKDAADIALRRLELELKYNAQNLQQQFEMEMHRDEQELEGTRLVADHSLAAQGQQHQQSLAEAQHEHETRLAEEQQAHEQDIARQQVAQQAASGSDA